MGKHVKLHKGYDIPIEGEAEKVTKDLSQPKTFAVKPTDFEGMRPIPKLEVKQGDEVKAGDPLFYDKPHPDIMYTAPVSGEVVEVKRGTKRKIEALVILADKEPKFRSFKKADPNKLKHDDILQRMLASGVWPLLRQRPFNVVPDPKVKPKNIFVSGFHTAPLAADTDYTLHGQGELFQAGLDALARLTEGKVHLGLSSGAGIKHTDVLNKAKNVEKHYFKGPHPAGNVGIQIHHIDPIRKGDVIWTMQPEDIVILGRLFLEGKYDPKRLVALGGPEVKKPRYFQTRLGANVAGMLKDNLKTDHVRVISGDVLTGRNIGAEGHLGTFDTQVSVILEGDASEFIGWLLPSYPRPTVSQSFPYYWMSLLFPDKKFRVNTNMHGESRPYVVTGQYEKVLPMNLYPQHLIKSILYEDFDEMEGLGIFEVVEEDLALCEFACTSKVRVQEILRHGLDKMRIEG